MNIEKNKSIRKGFVFSKGILPAVGALALVTQMGCSQAGGRLGGIKSVNEDTNQGPFPCSDSDKVDKIPLNDGSDRLFTPETINLFFTITNGIPVKSSAKKLILFIKKLANDGEQPVYPPEDPNAGKAILDDKGKPIDYNGIVFCNPTDKCYQVVTGDGTGVIIINQPTQEQIEKIKNMLKNCNLGSIEDVKKLTRDMPKMGIKDFYNSDMKYVNTELKKISNNTTSDHGCCGLYRRDDNNICRAIYIEGPFRFHNGTTATPQDFKYGAVAIKLEQKLEQGGGGDTIRLVRRDKFIESYTDINGKKMAIEGLSKVPA